MKVVAGEVLETGWEPTTPGDDTVLRRAVLALAEEREHTARDLGGRATRSAGVSMADAGSPSPFLNGAVLLRPLGRARWGGPGRGGRAFLRLRVRQRGPAVQRLAHPGPAGARLGAGRPPSADAAPPWWRRAAGPRRAGGRAGRRPSGPGRLRGHPGGGLPAGGAAAATARPPVPPGRSGPGAPPLLGRTGGPPPGERLRGLGGRRPGGRGLGGDPAGGTRARLRGGADLAGPPSPSRGCRRSCWRATTAAPSTSAWGSSPCCGSPSGCTPGAPSRGAHRGWRNRPSGGCLPAHVLVRACVGGETRPASAVVGAGR